MAANPDGADSPVVGIVPPGQFWIADYFKTGEASELEASALTVARRLVKLLKAQGYTSFEAPELPSAGVAYAAKSAGCRVLVMWIPDWASSDHAGEWACRADTLASGKAEV